MKRYLVLEDGTIYTGEGFGFDQETAGEIVFNTGMSGYQESITDQSYNGEILMFTYPLIGNYGINRDDDESMQPTCQAVVVHELARRSSNWRQNMSLDEYLKIHHIPGISGIDTRAVTRHIRQKGALKAAIVKEVTAQTIPQLQQTTLPRNQVALSTTKSPYPGPATGLKVVVVDFGLKNSILRQLAKRNCNFTVVPAQTTAAEILNLDPDGVLLSNGPGNPKDVPQALAVIRTLQTHVPLLVIV
ncbi:carbamoyl phosphate synthase small subunit, partial [Lactobacillus sp. XV13L]|nr:carbamoyl phosphate synthase small subunit [Lactobacillus sp. XV13L]